MSHHGNPEGPNPVTVNMPMSLTPDLIEAIRTHPSTAPSNPNEWHMKLSFFICAYDIVMREVVKKRVSDV